MNYSGLGNKNYQVNKKKVNIYGENLKTKSSVVKSFCYHPLSSTLEIVFNTNTTYVYFKVSPGVYAKFATAKSTGKAFHALINKRFKVMKL
jgi:hypothetical protein